MELDHDFKCKTLCGNIFVTFVHAASFLVILLRYSWCIVEGLHYHRVRETFYAVHLWLRS